MRDLLSSVFNKRCAWANRSRRSLKKSDNEQIALVALYKRATVSESLFTKERPWVNRSWFSGKNLYILYIFHCFSIFMPNRELLPSLFALWLFTKEWPWVICSRCSLHKSNASDLLFFKSTLLFRSQKNEQFARKTKEGIPNPAKIGGSDRRKKLKVKAKHIFTRYMRHSIGINSFVVF